MCFRYPWYTIHIKIITENYELDYAKEYKKRKDREEELTEKNYERDPDLIDISQYHPEDIHLEGKYE